MPDSQGLYTVECQQQPKLNFGWMTKLYIENVQLSYQTKADFMKKVGIQGATFSLIGENLHVWDKLKDKIFDPVQATGNGARYPLQRVFTLQLNLNF